MKLSNVELDEFREEEDGLSGWVNVEFENGLKFERAWQMQVRRGNIVVTPSLKFKGILKSFPRLQNASTPDSIRTKIREELREQYPERCPNPHKIH